MENEDNFREFDSQTKIKSRKPLMKFKIKKFIKPIVIFLIILVGLWSLMSETAYLHIWIKTAEIQQFIVHQKNIINEKHLDSLYIDLSKKNTQIKNKIKLIDKNSQFWEDLETEIKFKKDKLWKK